RRRNERIGRKRSLSDSEQKRFGARGLATFFTDTAVFILVTKAINLFLKEEVRIADILDLDPAKHLSNDHLDVLVVDVNALQTIDFLDLVHDIILQFFHTSNAENIVRVKRSVHERLAGLDRVTVLNIDMRTARNVVFAFAAVFIRDDDLALAL